MKVRALSRWRRYSSRVFMSEMDLYVTLAERMEE